MMSAVSRPRSNRLVLRRTPLAAALMASFSVPMVAPAQDRSVSPAASAAEPAAAATRLPEVRVSGEQGESTNEYKADKPASVKYTELLLDTPQTVQIITSKVIEQQNQLSLRQMLSNVPGITFGAAEGGNGFGDNITLRGSRIENDIQLDGIRDAAQTARTDPFNLEQLEVTKGASSVYSGSGAVTGTINQVSKSAKADDFVKTSFGAGTDEYFRVTADANRKLSETSAARINLMTHRNDSPERDEVWFERWGIAPSIAFGLGTDLRTTINYLHQDNERVPDRGTLWRRSSSPGTGAPVPVDRSTYFGFSNVDRENATVDVFTATIEKDINTAMTLRNTTRQGSVDNDSTLATLNGLVCLGGVAFNPAATDPACPTPPAGATNTWSVSGNSLIPGNLRVDETMLSANVTDLTWDFKTGGIEHTVVLGISLTREEFNRDQKQARTATGAAFDTDPSNDAEPGGDTDGPDINLSASATIDLDNPNRVWTGPLNWVTQTQLQNELENQAIYAFDTLKFGEQWQLNAGLRLERNEANYRTFNVGGTTPSTDLDSNDTLVSGRLGVVYKPSPISSVYAAYGNSEAPSAATVTTSCTASATVQNCNTDPEETVSYEIGTKWELFERQLLVTGAVFRNDRTNARVNNGDPVDPIQVLDGRSRVDGVELGASGQITERWAVQAGFAWLDSEVLQSVADNAAVNVIDAQKGEEIPNTPEASGSLWTSYVLPGGLELGYGLTYIGEYKTEANALTTTVPDATIQNALLGYPLGRGLDLRLNINNLADKQYWSSVRPQGWAHPGEGRSMVLTANYEF